jgi:heptosyltransferase-3
MSTKNKRRVLLIQTRNLGDAVISTALIETIAHGLPAAEIDVLTRPEIAQIFARNPHVNETITGRFPMGSVRDFGLKQALLLPGLINTLRRKKYTDVVNMTGDLREEFLARLITRRNNWSPAWAADHPVKQTVRPSVIPLANRPIFIPRNKPNIHDAAAIIGISVTGGAPWKPALYTPEKKKIAWNPLPHAVGIHPMASQPCRRWELYRWKAVAAVLVEREIDVYVFGSPAEESELTRHFGQLDASRVRIMTGSLTDYFAAVSKMRVLLCPDSFAAHVAYALGVPTILLNGANDAAAWAPPGTTVLAAGPELSCYPCYNRPTCFGSANEFACVRRIREQSVLETVWEVLNTKSSQLYRHIEPAI